MKKNRIVDKKLAEKLGEREKHALIELSQVIKSGEKINIIYYS